MALTSLPDSNIPQVEKSPATRLYEYLILEGNSNLISEFEFSLWHKLGSAKSVDDLKKVIKSFQRPAFHFDPDAFDQQFTLKETDRVIVIKEMRRRETRGTLREIRGYIDFLDEYYYYNGSDTEVYPLNHFISPEFYRAIENFVGCLVKDYIADLAKVGKMARKSLFIELL